LIIPEDRILFTSFRLVKAFEGRNPQTDVAAHAAAVVQATRVVEDVRYLLQEVHRLLEVVVVDGRGLLDAAQRQEELGAALALLTEVAARAPVATQGELQRLVTLVKETLPSLLTFVEPVARMQQALQGALPAERQALLAWTWLRRKGLGWTSRELVAAVPEAWRAGAWVLVATWEDAVRVSRAVERWHSILRPHLAVHRTLSRGRLALLAGWHNHRVFPRGGHKGQSPLHLSGMVEAPTDWLVALGYEAAEAEPGPLQPGPAASALALAA
jgi:hypothetical protein